MKSKSKENKFFLENLLKPLDLAENEKMLFFFEEM